MKVIYNNLIPFKGFLAINLFGVLFVRKEYKKYLDEVDVNHESIHSEQIKELGYIFFYIIYTLEWLFRLFLTKDMFSHQAYRNISFEQEAYSNEKNMEYISKRKHYAQWRKRSM